MGIAPLERIAMTRRYLPFTLTSMIFLNLWITSLAFSPTGLEESLPPLEPDPNRPTILVVVGAPGEPEFGDLFEQQAEDWRTVARIALANFHRIGWRPNTEPKSEVSKEAASGELPKDQDPDVHAELDGSEQPTDAQAWKNVEDIEESEAAGRTVNESKPPAQPNVDSPSDLERLQDYLSAQCPDSSVPFWIVIIGHGTWDGRIAKFNLQGPDLTPDQLAGWLASWNRPVVILQTASASSPFLAPLSKPNRVIVTATRSGYELNFARFGLYLARAIQEPEADLDRDGQTSLLEAFLSASRQVTEFYETEGRLVTEHALIDDNGDGLGTPADWFVGLRAVKRAQDGKAMDGIRAHQWHLLPSKRELRLTDTQRARRNQLEQAIYELREARSKLAEPVFFERLETLLLELANLYEATSAPSTY